MLRFPYERLLQNFSFDDSLSVLAHRICRPTAYIKFLTRKMMQVLSVNI